jgi:hypothetical protein
LLFMMQRGVCAGKSCLVGLISAGWSAAVGTGGVVALLKTLFMRRRASLMRNDNQYPLPLSHYYPSSTSDTENNNQQKHDILRQPVGKPAGRWREKLDTSGLRYNVGVRARVSVHGFLTLLSGSKVLVLSSRGRRKWLLTLEQCQNAKVLKVPGCSFRCRSLQHFKDFKATRNLGTCL